MDGTSAAPDLHPEPGLPALTRPIGPKDRKLVAKTVGAELRRMRKRAGLTSHEAAALMGTQNNHIYEHEGGRCAMRIDRLIRYVRAYNGSLLEIERAVERALAGQEP